MVLDNDIACTCTLTTTLNCLQKIYAKVYYALYEYCIIVKRSCPDKHFLLKFSNRNTRKWCELCSELIIKTLEH